MNANVETREIQQTVGVAKDAASEAVPNYPWFHRIPGQERELTWHANVLAYLRGLTFRSLTLVLLMASLTTIGVCAVWPHREIQPAGAMTAIAVAIVAGIVSLVVLLTERGDSRAASTEHNPDLPSDP